MSPASLLCMQDCQWTPLGKPGTEDRALSRFLRHGYVSHWVSASAAVMDGDLSIGQEL